MEQLFNDTKALHIAIEAGQITSPQFINIKNYENSKGEIADHLINMGVSYNKARQADFDFLRGLKEDKEAFDKIFTDSDDAIKDMSKTALDELITSMEKNIAGGEEKTNQSKAQADAYNHLFENVKEHIESGKFYVYGMAVRKTVHQEGEYKKVKSRPKTLAKKLIQKELKTSKFRQFTIDSISQIKINGTEMIFG